MNFIETAWKVRPVLEENLYARDNDRLLISKIWQREIENLPPQCAEMSIFELLEDGLLENPETITRVRRKLQETLKHLRGEMWGRRHNAEAECCRQLSFFDIWNY